MKSRCRATRPCGLRISRFQSFAIKGKTSRISTIDREIDVMGTTATVREDKTTQHVAVPERFFTLGGYAPISVQMLLADALRAHPDTTTIANLPSQGLFKSRGAEPTPFKSAAKRSARTIRHNRSRVANART